MRHRKKPHVIPRPIPMPDERISPLCFVLLTIAALSLILSLIARADMQFADFYNRTAGAFFRAALSFITDIFPFSFAEFLVLLLPLLIGLLIAYGIRRKSRTVRSVLSYAVSLLAAASLLFSMFTLNFGIAYHTTPLDEKLSLEASEVTADELAQTAEKLISELSSYRFSVRYADSGASVMPYSLSEMNDKLLDAYEALALEYDFITTRDSRLKPVMLSRLMSYAHFTGFYTFFTGEANINIDFPSYTIPFTAAHELAHQRGIARENEANFMAFLVCMASDDDYIRYCGLVNLYDYVASALYEADTSEDKALYRKATEALNQGVQGERIAYRKFFEPYSQSGLSEITTTLNDSFLKVNGNEAGSKSYGLVVDLAVAYYKKR